MYVIKNIYFYYIFQDGQVDLVTVMLFDTRNISLFNFNTVL